MGFGSHIWWTVSLEWLEDPLSRLFHQAHVNTEVLPGYSLRDMLSSGEILWGLGFRQKSGLRIFTLMTWQLTSKRQGKEVAKPVNATHLFCHIILIKATIKPMQSQGAGEIESPPWRDSRKVTLQESLWYREYFWGHLWKNIFQH